MTLRAWLVGAGASAETVTGRVEISDGDTIMVLMEQRQVKVRLADIDAPEKQAGVGTRSKQALSISTSGRMPAY